MIVNQVDQPLGFLSAEFINRDLHVWELSVGLENQRRGLGRALMEHAIAEAGKRRVDALTLTTFRDVPWNAPFYQRLGFHILENDQLDARLRATLEGEVAHGFLADTRCAMHLALNAPSIGAESTHP
ncbi:hypothetical protein GCM10010136_05450 [Limoniibacter endophyticus]|uniref:N-acetyltransferase domain-containing protein n=1 Tax=Limoniibacter endophyticus TaxID=1565040 RepID=A0A8J3DG88_9HYPH|nr:hypothetical protein GCM10010136_05450 [Limoniibacter endophyticus]